MITLNAQKGSRSNILQPLRRLPGQTHTVSSGYHQGAAPTDNRVEERKTAVVLWQGRGNDFFLGGGKSVAMPSGCQILGGGAQAYPSH